MKRLREGASMLATRKAAAMIGFVAASWAIVGAAQGAEDAFARLDADGSETITWKEAYQVRIREFTEMDSDGNGFLIEDEFVGPARPLTAFDSDEDGRVHMSEFLGGHRSMFDRFDEDASDSLDPNEFEAAQMA